MVLAGPRERVELRFASRLGCPPLRCNPSLLLQSMKGGIERALRNLQVFVRYLLNPFRDGPAMLRFEREDLQNQQIERALDEVGRFAHGYYDGRQYAKHCR